MTNNIKLYKRCPACSFFCNAAEPDGFCSICGTKLIETCSDCHNTIDNPYAKFCKFCGKPFNKNDEKSATGFFS